MKPVLLHGPAINVSRQKLLEIRKKFDPDSVVVFDKGAAANEILINLQSQSMFNDNRLVIVENPPEDFLLNNFKFDSQSLVTLVIWFDKEVKKLPDKKDFDILFFPEAKESSIFPLLDLLAAGDKKAFSEFNKLKKGNFDIQYFITMIFYMLRSLVVAPKNAPSFVKNKLSKQRARFKDGELTELYKFVLETDYKIKSGLLEVDQAEFLLINKFMV